MIVIPRLSADSILDIQVHKDSSKRIKHKTCVITQIPYPGSTLLTHRFLTVSVSNSYYCRQLRVELCFCQQVCCCCCCSILCIFVFDSDTTKYFLMCYTYVYRYLKCIYYLSFYEETRTTGFTVWIEKPGSLPDCCRILN